jgi:hypothetical protein
LASGLLLAAACALAAPGLAATTAIDGQDVTSLRVFLKDGTTLVSYGEPARIDDRVVFSMPTSASPSDPRLHLVEVSTEMVDWDRTTRYAEAARAARYVATMAETHYAQLTYEITQALNDVAMTEDPARRLAIVERARRTLAAWPASHFNYKKAEVDRMLALLDEAIADLRAAAGVSQFDLNLVAAVEPPRMHDPLLPPPTTQELVNQTLRVASLTDRPAERTSLLATALTTLDREAAALPTNWVAATRQSVQAQYEAELDIDRRYRALTARVVNLARQRAQAADVRGVERLEAEVRARDAELGSRRPASVDAMLGVVREQLDAARRLRLAHDRWAMRAMVLRRYTTAIASPLDRLSLLKGALEDVKALAGSAPAALASLEQTAAWALKAMSTLVPPDEFRTVHTLLINAAQLADSAARLRREAVISGDLGRAWDASSAAAGSLMLTSRARIEIETVLRPPPLPR